MARLKLGPGFQVLPVGAGVGHLSDAHTGDALVLPPADFELMEQVAAEGLDLGAPGARELYERYRPFLVQSEGGAAFFELDINDAPPSIAPLGGTPRPSPTRPSAPLGNLIAEELTEPIVATVAPPIAPLVTRVATPVTHAPIPSALPDDWSAEVTHLAGAPQPQTETWSVEPVKQAFVPQEAKDLARKLEAAHAQTEVQDFFSAPAAPPEEEPLAELEALPDDAEEPVITGQSLVADPPAPAFSSPSSADVLTLVGQSVFDRSPSYTEQAPPPPPAPKPLAPPPGVMALEAAAAAAPPPPIPAPPGPDLSQADNLRQALGDAGVAPAMEGSVPAPKSRAMMFVGAGVVVLVLGVAATLALRPGDDSPKPMVETPDAGVVAVVKETPPTPTPVPEVVDAGAAVVAVKPPDQPKPPPDQPKPPPEQPKSEWSEGAVSARGRVKMASVSAQADGTLSWSVTDGQRVKTKQALGTLTTEKELPVVAENVGLVMFKQGAGPVKKGSVLADIIYFEAWAKAVVKVTPTSAWKCEIASAAKGQSAPCHISVVTPKAGGAQLTVAVEPMWFDDAGDAVVRVAP